MKPFLIDNDKVYTYQDLLDAIQTDGFYSVSYTHLTLPTN